MKFSRNLSLYWRLLASYLLLIVVCCTIFFASAETFGPILLDHHVRDMQAAGLWYSLPAAHRQCAVLYTDFWKAYAEVFPSKRHQAVGKSSGKTNYIERFNCTLQHRVSRPVRSTLSFSKKLENHIGAIWTFVYHNYASLCL